MWFWFAIISSLLAAISVVYNKHTLRSISPKLLAWALFVFPIPFLIIGTLASERSRINNMFWLGVSGSAAVFVMAKLWQLEAIQKGLLSKLIPLAPLAVLFSYVLSFVFLGENISLMGLFGMSIIIIGTYLFNIELAQEGFFQPFLILFKERETLLYMVALFFGALTSVFDKTGLINTKPTNPLLTLLFENILTAIPFTFYLILKVPLWNDQLKKSFWQLLIAGLLYSLSVIFVFYGFSTGPIALSIAIRQSQTVFIILFSFFIFSDKPPAKTWFAILVMFIGVVLLKLA